MNINSFSELNVDKNKQVKDKEYISRQIKGFAYRLIRLLNKEYDSFEGPEFPSPSYKAFMQLVQLDLLDWYPVWHISPTLQYTKNNQHAILKFKIEDKDGERVGFSITWNLEFNAPNSLIFGYIDYPIDTHGYLELTFAMADEDLNIYTNHFTPVKLHSPLIMDCRHFKIYYNDNYPESNYLI